MVCGNTSSRAPYSITILAQSSTFSKLQFSNFQVLASVDAASPFSASSASAISDADTEITLQPNMLEVECFLSVACRSAHVNIFF